MVRPTKDPWRGSEVRSASEIPRSALLTGGAGFGTLSGVCDPISTTEVLGVACFVGNQDHAARKIVERVKEQRGGYVCLCNVHVLVSAKRDSRIADALSGAWLNLPDGAPVAWLQRRLGASRARRVGGPDLMPAVLDLGRSHSLRHFLFGSTPEVVDRLSKNLAASYPGIQFAGALSPPFGQWSRETESALLCEIAAAQPDVVWCALGAPRQELWMRQSHAALSPALLLGVGAAFDFLAGSKPRAPRWMQRSGLEWLHRLASEPRRLAGRYLRTNAEYVVRAIVAIGRSR